MPGVGISISGYSISPGKAVHKCTLPSFNFAWVDRESHALFHPFTEDEKQAPASAKNGAPGGARSLLFIFITCLHRQRDRRSPGPFRRSAADKPSTARDGAPYDLTRRHAPLHNASAHS